LLKFDSGFSKEDPVDSPVFVGSLTFNQLQFFQVVHQPGNAWFITKCCIAKFLLTHSVLFPQMIEQTPLLNRNSKTGTIKLFLQAPCNGSRGLACYKAI